MILTCLKIARKKGLTVSFDGNFRSTLWTWEEACLLYTSTGNLDIEIWERGSGYTKASGTGSCAAAVTAYRLGLSLIHI